MVLKTIIRILFGFLNFRNMIRLHAWWLWPRRSRVFFLFEGATYTYGETYCQARRYADFFLGERRRLLAAGVLKGRQRLAVGIYMDNAPQFIFAALGAGLSNTVLFAINTGFRGETLARVIDQSGIALLVVNDGTLVEAGRAMGHARTVGRGDMLYAGDETAAAAAGCRSLEAAVAKAAPDGGRRYSVPIDNFSPVLVIFTSGTTGLPKGVPCSHIKLFGAGWTVQGDVRLTRRDRGYICMPLFHSNAWYIGILPLLIAGGSFVLKRKFSASAFESDVLDHGVTFLNYVGQPLHYIIAALEKKYGTEAAIEKALARHPRNRFRIAYGNGASVVDRKKMTRYFGLAHIYEIYGSTEAVIATTNRPGDPFESVGRAARGIVILNEEGKPCPPGVADPSGHLVNYDQAVGEIARKVGRSNLRFEGYYGDGKATDRKFRDGYYHSGDLGHIRIIGGRRYLYFNGRTDDWIRKDGENFSAESVLRYALEIPGVAEAIAYGAPCEASDEKVMIAVQLAEGAEFRPGEVFDWLMAQQQSGGMDPKWMPDFIRIVERFAVTDTQKIPVKPFKQEHYNIEKRPDMVIYFRDRGDRGYRPLTPESYRQLKGRFVDNGRAALLEQG